MEDIDYYREKHSYVDAKIKAVMDYLHKFLKCDDQELKEMNIRDTLVSAKGDNTINVVFDNLDHIKEIHLRIVKCRNPELATCNYIPPGFYDRFMAANIKCSEVRQEDPEIKTQIRFNNSDIEVLTKTRGSNKPYRSVNL